MLVISVLFFVGGKPNGIVITEELREELNQAAASTAQAYGNVRTLASGDDVTNNPALGYALEDMLAEKLERHRSGAGSEREEGQLGTKVLVMQPILRFLQLLCENHNRDLQASTEYCFVFTKANSLLYRRREFCTVASISIVTSALN